MRQETIYREISSNKISGNAPIFFHLNRQNFSTQLFGNPLYIVFVFFPIESTGTVNQNSTGFQASPDITQNTLLTLPAKRNIVYTPFVYSHLVFAEHTFSRARHISQNHIEYLLQFCKIGRIVVCHHHSGMSPFYQILCQYLRTVSHHLVGYQQTSFGQYAAGQCRFTTGGCTKIEHHRRSMYILPQSLLYKHRRGLLHVIASGMKEGIESKGRTDRKIISGRTPGYRTSVLRYL